MKLINYYKLELLKLFVFWFIIGDGPGSVKLYFRLVKISDYIRRRKRRKSDQKRSKKSNLNSNSLLHNRAQ